MTLKNDKRHPSTKLISVGVRFGRLTVIGVGEKRWKTSDAWWDCQCTCGGHKTITGHDLRVGRVRSCGCLQRETRRVMASVANLQHGHALRSGTRTRIYNVWVQMKWRCRSPKSPMYHHYGGRGIAVCERWLNFENFLADMGEPPKGMSLDRINNDGNYEPSNCRWATQKDQCNNTRRNVFLTHNGERKTVAQWARIVGVPRRTIDGRLQARRVYPARWPISRVLLNYGQLDILYRRLQAFVGTTIDIDN